MHSRRSSRTRSIHEPRARPRIGAHEAPMSMIGELIGVSPDKLNRLLGAPEQVEDFIQEEYDNPESECYLGKAWHALHFILTGTPWDGDEPLCLAVLCGTPIGEVDVGYGPARYLTP